MISPRNIAAAAVRFIRERPLIIVLLLLLAVAGVVMISRARRTVSAQHVYYPARRGDFTVTILEGGTLRAAQEVTVRCELEGTPRIISIVPEGTSVKKGDLLVQLDASGVKDKLSTQELAVQSAEAAYSKAKEDLAIQKLTLDAAIKDQELKVEFSESDLEKYKEGEWPQQKQAVQARITIAEEEMQRAQDRLNWTEKLEKRGYATRDELKADQLTVKRSELTIAQAREELRLAQKYDYPKKSRQLESLVESAKLELVRVKQRATSTINSFETDLKAKLTSLDLQRERLADARAQLDLVKIYAPKDGLVVYATGSSSGSGILIEEGATVRQKQELIRLPDVTQMMVEIKVHESHVRQVKPGLPAVVTIDSLPDKQFTGYVKKVAVLPDSTSRYYNPNLKVYTTEVWINESMQDIKPGVSGRAEVIVTNLHEVVTVPIQAVTTVKGQQVCFVQKNGHDVSVPVEVGLYNDRLIEVRRGLAEGDRVRLDALVATESSPGENGEGRTDEGESNQRTNFPKAVPLAPTLAPTNAPAAGKPALTRSPLLPAKPEFGKLSAPAPQKPVAPGK
jgi:HlyD family secretion protein